MGDFNFSDENYVKEEETEEEKERRRKKEADRPKSKFEKVLTVAEIAAKEKEEAEVVRMSSHIITLLYTSIAPLYIVVTQVYTPYIHLTHLSNYPLTTLFTPLYIHHYVLNPSNIPW